MARRKQTTKVRAQPLLMAQARTFETARVNPEAWALVGLADAYADHVRVYLDLPDYADGGETEVRRALAKADALDRAAADKFARAKEFEEHSPGARRAALGVAEKHDRPDPGVPNQTVRGLRVVCQYDTMWRRGTLNDAQREACDRYLIECEAEQGARDRPQAAGMIARTPPWMQGHPAERQVQAVVSLRAARGAVGLNGRALLDLLVVQNLAVKFIAERRKEDEKVTMGQVKATLTRLAEWWSM